MKKVIKHFGIKLAICLVVNILLTIIMKNVIGIVDSYEDLYLFYLILDMIILAFNSPSEFFNSMLDVDYNNTYAGGKYNATLYNCDEAKGRAIAEIEKLSGSTTLATMSGARYYANHFHTDVGTGALISAAANASKDNCASLKISSNARYYANLYNVDLGSGATVAALELLQENMNKKENKTK